MHVGGLEHELLLREGAHAQIGRKRAQRGGGAETEHGAAVHDVLPGAVSLRRRRAAPACRSCAHWSWRALIQARMRARQLSYHMMTGRRRVSRAMSRSTDLSVTRPLSAPRSLTGELVARLTDDITSGKIPRGLRLPTEQALIAATGVSRTVVREA